MSSIRLIFCFWLIVLLLLPAGCGKVIENTSPAAALKGFGISPLGFPLDYSKLLDFYTEVSGMDRGAVMWNGAWRDDIVNGTETGWPDAWKLFGSVSVRNGSGGQRKVYDKWLSFSF